jgi:2-polyprenyl-3-methyl-5-hydroxy-6-metoxy-1,4-benzoquinol methylase
MAKESSFAGNTRPNEADYQRLAEEEIQHYSDIFLGEQSDPSARKTLLQPVPAAWIEMENRASALIKARTGHHVAGHVMARLSAFPTARVLSLGSGPGGLELAFAREAPRATIKCMDLNPELAALGRERARSEGLNVEFEVADLNRVELPHEQFDIVFCHASLHHLLELERIAFHIERALRPEAVLITVDICTRNGYLMWPETRAVVRGVFQTLPARFRVNHTAYGKPKVDTDIWEMDTSAVSMECIRAEDIIPILAKTFLVQHFVPYFSICRRFLDTMYGPNFDLSLPLDVSLLNWLWELDLHYLHLGKLKPETFFGVYGKR